MYYKKSKNITNKKQELINLHSKYKNRKILTVDNLGLDNFIL